VDSKRIEKLAQGARGELFKETVAALHRVLAEGSSERLTSRTAVQAIEQEIAKFGEAALVERVAYTWFNRLCALRFMDVRGYTPVGTVSPRENATTIAILADAQQGVFLADLDIANNVKDSVNYLLSGATASTNPLNDAYKLLLKAVCDHYAKPMGYLFGGTDDLAKAINLLMPDDLISQDSILKRVCDGMDEATCESVEVLGWLYQYYIAERKDEVFAGFKKNKKAGAAEIASATQLFTPNWIVRYLVENSLGRLWLLNKPNSSLREKMDYYIEGDEITEFQKISVPTQISCLDPACGSGHILVYMFDLLYEMYEESGYMPEDIPTLILENNLTGFEIDPRAAEIASFALEMKALERDSAFLSKNIDPNITVLEKVEFDGDALTTLPLLQGRQELLAALAHMDEVGSLYKPDPSDMLIVQSCKDDLVKGSTLLSEIIKDKLEVSIKNCEALNSCFDVVVANPPYMGSGNMNAWLSEWLKLNYPDEKSDLFSSFIARNSIFAKPMGQIGMMTPYVWMFISSYEKLRSMLIQRKTITSLIQLEYSGFADATVPICTFTFENSPNESYRGAYIRLSDFVGPSVQALKTLEAINNPDCGWFYRRSAKDFTAIPGSPIAYWASDSIYNNFVSGTPISTIAPSYVGIMTGDAGRFIRCWWEVDNERTMMDSSSLEEAVNSMKKWFPCNKGGTYRKWYGNDLFIINWLNNGIEVKTLSSGDHRHYQDYKDEYKFKETITWTAISSSKPSFRIKPRGFLTEHAGFCIQPSAEKQYLTLGLCNSIVVSHILSLLSPTLNFTAGDVIKIPIISTNQCTVDFVSKISKQCVQGSRADWDSFETSRGFQRHPLV
jgi:type I restriction-modification system DNA methylase subunit